MKSLLFRRGSRKKHVILVSLCRRAKVGVLCLAYSLVKRMLLINGQSDTVDMNSRITEIQQIEVTGFRNQAVFSEVSRLVTAKQAEDIEEAGIHSLQDLLEYVANIDIRHRGLPNQRVMRRIPILT